MPLWGVDRIVIRHRKDILIKRFDGRENLGKDGLYARFFESMGLVKNEVLECLDEIELGYEIPAGLLRPEDKMQKLNDRVQTMNPLEWFLWLGRNEFSADEITGELNRRLRKFGTFKDWTTIETFGDLVLAWCGKKPSARATDSKRS